MEALPAADLLLPLNITLFCFDFAGSGLSEGEYISLGWYEKDDVEAVFNHLRGSGTVSAIGLWGRSMGAVTALFHADRDPSIAGMVIDSAFSDLNLLSEELARMHTGMPKFIISSTMSFVRKTIQSKAKFDMNHITPIKHVQSGFIPAFFVTSKDDTFILPHHTQELYKKYSGDKNLVVVEGDHNSVRPQFLLDSIAIFFYNTLLCELLPKSNDPIIAGKDSNEEKDFRLAESYVKHNQKMRENFIMGNAKILVDDVEGFDVIDMEQAINELTKKIQKEETLEEKVSNEPKAEEVIVQKKNEKVSNEEKVGHKEIMVEKEGKIKGKPTFSLKC